MGGIRLHISSATADCTDCMYYCTITVVVLTNFLLSFHISQNKSSNERSRLFVISHWSDLTSFFLIISEFHIKVKFVKTSTVHYSYLMMDPFLVHNGSKTTITQMKWMSLMNEPTSSTCMYVRVKWKLLLQKGQRKKCINTTMAAGGGTTWYAGLVHACVQYT